MSEEKSEVTKPITKEKDPKKVEQGKNYKKGEAPPPLPPPPPPSRPKRNPSWDRD